MDDSKTFREELAIQYPTLGRPIWEPDPGGLYKAVQVGDVGFIRQGYFYCLFNALPPRDTPDHPPESDPNFPHDLERLQPRTPITSARVGTTAKIFARRTLQMCLVSLTSMH